MSGQVGDKQADYNWLARSVDDTGEVENDYGSDDFSSTLAGKLKELTSGVLGPGAFIHFNNVSIAYTHLYGFDIEGVGANAALVTRSGEQGSVAELRIPAAAGLLHKAWNIVVGPELTWSAVATTTDFASEAQAVTARNALTYYWEHENVAPRAKSIAFEAMSFGECAAHIPWNKELGQEMGVDESNPDAPKLLHAGDVDYRRISTWDILRDPYARSFDSLNWIIVREWPDKFDVAASCEDPDAAQAALASNAVDAPIQGWAPWQARNYAQSNQNRIPVYYLYAKRTPSVPAGRQTVFLQDGTIIEDGPLDEAYVEHLPVVVLRADEYRGTPWPYTKFFAVLGAQQARDGLYKDLLTNATAITGPVISVEDDAMDSAPPTQLAGGPRVVPRPKGTQVPAVLNINSAHPDHFKLAATVGSEMQQILGIDNITAGLEVGANLSGAAMALMTSTSVQNNSQWQAAWAKFNQACGNVVLKHIQKHMSVPKRIALAGASRSSLVTTTEVSGTSVEGIERVLCTIGPALQQTDAGKYEIATTALKEHWVKTPEQFQEVLDTGRLDALSEDLSNELLLIRAENEALGRGEDVPVMLDDDHMLHLKRHPAVTASLTARRDPKVVAALQAHQDAHIRVLRETDPQILAIFGQQPLTPAAGPPGAGGAPSGPPEPNKPPQDQQKAQAPSMPTNPVTNEKAAPVAGASPPGLAVKPN